MSSDSQSPSARTLLATTGEELDQLPLHDQRLDLDGMLYADGRVTFPCFVDDSLPPVVTKRRRDGSPKQWDTPLRAALLSISAIGTPRLIDDQGIGRYMLNELRFSDGVVYLEACEALVVEVPVERCEVSLTIRDEVAAYVTRRRHWLSESEFGFRLVPSTTT